MKKRVVAAVLFAAVGAVAGLAAGAWADEGMWLLTNPPKAVLKERYGFEPTPEWLEHMQKSAVRFQTGGSGSLVSPDGLVMTNHHVGSDMLVALSTPEKNLLEKGFYARTRVEELKCPDLELNILWSIEDVTERVKGAGGSASAAAAGAARRKMIGAIEAECLEKTGLKGEVVTLYQGAQYHLYRYKRYTDVRLVFAPEEKAANFGGDTDNFEFPRYCTDFAFFRIYENNQPLRPEHYLKWSATGSKEGDLALVFGHPGKTQRLNTVDHLKFLRDVQVPNSLRYLWRSEVWWQGFTGRNADNALYAAEDLAGVSNSRKAYMGQIEGLEDPALMARKSEAEGKLREAAKASGGAGDEAWGKLGAALGEYRTYYVRNYVLTKCMNTELLTAAKNLVMMAEELPKPSAERLPEFADAALPTVELDLYSPAPVHDALEIEKLAMGLSYLAETQGGDDPLVVKLLEGKSPRERAEEAVYGTSLKSVEVRKAMAKGGKAALDLSKDPMIVLARAIDPELRMLRKKFEDGFESVQRESYAKVAAAAFAANGEKVYPDATFTLRMSFGPVKGYVEDGAAVAPYTRIAGMYLRSMDRRGRPEFVVADRWQAARDKVDVSTPMNFVCTADIIGGNSGSPVVNTAGEVVGLIFDGNIQSLRWAFEYNDVQARAVAVDGRAIMESLRKVYEAGELADEIVGK